MSDKDTYEFYSANQLPQECPTFVMEQTLLKSNIPFCGQVAAQRKLMYVSLNELLDREDYMLFYLAKNEVAVIFDDGKIRRLSKLLSSLTPAQIRSKLIVLKRVVRKES